MYVEEILKLDESCISNPEIRNIELDLASGQSNSIFRISGFEMQDSSNFKISSTYIEVRPRILSRPKMPERSMVRRDGAAGRSSPAIHGHSTVFAQTPWPPPQARVPCFRECPGRTPR